MAMMLRTTAAMMITALLAATASPALARGPHGGGWNKGGWGGGGWRHRRDRDNISTGDVLTGLLILGGIVAIASSASKKKGKPMPEEVDTEEVGEHAGITGAIADEDMAVEACADAARLRASEDGRNANVRNISSVEPTNDGWEIRGTVETRQGYRTAYSDSRGFNCTVRFGQVEQVLLDSSVAVR